MVSFSELKKKSVITYKRTLLYIVSKSKPLERKVLFESFNGKAYSDNPRAISEELHSMDPTIQIVWVINKEDLAASLPSYIRTVKRHSFQYVQELATCSCYVTNESLNTYMRKRKGQFFIQTWHGDRGFKKVLYDAKKKRKRPEVVFIMNEKLTDLCVAGSSYGERKFRSAFHYKGEILLEGTPRDDCLCEIDASRVKEIKKRLNIDEQVHCLLYAPTFRKNDVHSEEVQKLQGIDLAATIKKCEETYGGKWICLVRAHPISKGIDRRDFNENIVDVSKYPDMADLLMISDCLITDYSSSAGDFPLTHRPLFLFQDDIEYYTANERKFYFNIYDSPYIIVHSQEELEEAIAKTTLEDARKNCDKILDFYGTKESGKASNIVAGRIVEHVNNTVR